MSTYKVTFTPNEPWFFGNEKGFRFPGQNIGNTYRNSYFIKSEPIPSQSTILGALRYILIPEKKPLKEYTNDDIKRNIDYIGESSFNVDSKDIQRFGKIKTVSPIFIIKNGKTLIPAPMDHKAKKIDESKDHDNKKEYEQYDAFSRYEAVDTPEGKKLYTADYDSKTGVFDGFAELETGNIHCQSDVLSSEVRVGNRRFSDDSGFFKKEYYCFKTKKGEAYASFAVIAEIDVDDLDKKTYTVALGQGKSMFAVKFEKTNNDSKDFINNVTLFLIKHHKNFSCDDKVTFHYCLSDIFVQGDPYNKSLFAVVMTRDHRSFMTKERGQIAKGQNLHRLLRAGSVVISQDAKWALQFKNENAEQIGYNNIISIDLSNGGKVNE